MKTRLTAPIHVILALALVSGCVSPKAVRLHEDFLKRERLTVGVALGEVRSPGIRDWNGGYEHLRQYDWGNDDLGGEGRPGSRGDAPGGPPPVLDPLPRGEGSIFTLMPRMEAVGTHALMEAAERFAQGISRPGWRVVTLPAAVREVNAGAPSLQGLDALVILDYTWYGLRCLRTHEAGELAETGADLTARMVDLSTGGLLWRSPVIRIRNPLWCRCGDSDCHPVIVQGVREALFDAQKAAVKDFLGLVP